MARGSTVLSSIPDVPEGEIPDEDLMLSPEEEEALAAEEAETMDAAAAQEGYASHAEKVQYEAEAKQQGWKPLADYSGPAGGWKTAKKFVEDGRDFAPFIKRENQDLKARMTGMTREMEAIRGVLATTQADLKKVLEFSRRANQEGYDRAVRELKAKQREAVAAGDTVAFDQIDQQLDQMDQAREEAAPAADAAPARQAAPQAPPAAVEPATEDFIRANQWVLRDRELNAAMIRHEQDIREESPAMDTARVLERAKERTMGEFPKKFGLPEGGTPPAASDPPPRRQPAAPLPPSGNPPPRRPASKTGIDSIPDAAERAQCRLAFNRLKNTDPSLTESLYMAMYNDPHGDVIEARREAKGGK